MIKYIVFPGYVVSRNDDDRHYVCSTQLMRLHNIKPSECIVITKREDLYKLKGIQKDLIQIFPREDDKYTKYNNRIHAEILEDLYEIQQKIEAMDDPKDDENIRAMIGKAHYFLEACINKIEEIQPVVALDRQGRTS